MDNTTNFTSLCTTSRTVSRFPFSLILSLEIVTGLFSILPNVLLLIALIKAKVYPANLRYLLANLSFCLICQSCSNTAKAISILQKANRDPCLLIVNAFDCKLQDFLTSITGGTIFYSLLAVSLERVYCAIRYRRHDYSSSKPLVAGIFLFLMWSVSIATTVSTFSPTLKLTYMSVCESALYVNANGIFSMLFLALFIEIIPLVVIFLVRAYDRSNLRNTAINRVQHTLNFRFQLIQSAQINAVLVPSLVLHGICYTPTLIFYFVILYSVNLEIDSKWQLIHACTIYRLIYSCVHPLLALNRNPRLRQQLRKSNSTAKVWHSVAVQQKLKIKAMAVQSGTRQVNNINAHFNVLESVWAAGPSKKK